MPLQKSSIPINFAQGLDQKTDPLQVAPGRFLSLQNSIFDKAGRLTKRNGYGQLPSLPDTSSTFLTTFNGNLTAIGTSIHAFSQGSESWVSKGNINKAAFSTLPVIRSSTNQSQADTATAPNGLACTVYTDNIPNGSGSNDPAYYYVITDTSTGQNIVSPTLIRAATGTTTGSPRVFLLKNYFIIVFTDNISGTYHLEYLALSTMSATLVTPTAVSITAVYTPNSKVNFDGVVANDSLYLAWNGSDTSIKLIRLSSTLVLSSTKSFSGQTATIMSVTADTSASTAIIYAAYSDGSNGHVVAVNQNLITVLGPTSFGSATYVNLAAVANNGICTIYYEVSDTYSYDTIPNDFVRSITVTQAGVVGSVIDLILGVGLASKAVQVNGVNYFLVVYQSDNQPTYFLANGSGQIVSRFAYSNAGPYNILGLPQINVSGQTLSMAYLFKDLISSVNKTQGIANANGIYSQLGINLATIDLNPSSIVGAEIGSDLQFTGGFLWMYDGYSPVENGFFLWPDYVEVTTAGTGGLITAQEYFYQVTYEWADNQGNVFRSSPSIPVSVTTTGTTSANTVNVPTLRLTYKIANPVKICIYRWSTAQQTYYQVTSVQVPTMNDPTIDEIAFVDTLADSAIIGNNILYTTGGVIENISPPPTNVITLFDNRLWLVDAEDPNLLWYSKQVIEATPVEMSDLLTIYAAPTTSAQGSTGPTKAAAPMDDKLILFKANAIYYISGKGPDNTGANSQYSDATFITSTVGSSNQQSIVFIPQGLMFQSNKGIWLLERNLQTTYIGAPVEDFALGGLVQSAVNIPGTNQVRFTLDSGVTLLYDYFYGQWSTFVNVKAISSTIYESLHTYINSFGQAYQETPGKYLDGDQPVLMSFRTSWFNLAGLQGFERAYFFYLLGTYFSPHKLSVGIAYDYNPNPTQVSVISPDNFSLPWGGEQLWGSGTPWGGATNLEQWRVHLQQQKCEAFQLVITESFDASFGTIAGAGLTLSGIDLVVGSKGGYPRLKAARSVG